MLPLPVRRPHPRRTTPTHQDECADAPCQNGATCTHGVASYTCHCPEGWTGVLCEIAVCTETTCQNGGTCTDGPGGYTCDCPAGSLGTNCEGTRLLGAAAGDLSVPCCDGLACVNGICAEPACNFSGAWGDYATLETSESDVTGIWSEGINRPSFSGTITGSGCAVLMNFPDDALYEGTMVDACTIQWSYPNQPGTVNPGAYWTKANCTP